MPVPYTLDIAQRNWVLGLDPAIEDVEHDALLGTGPVIRVRWKGVPAAVKLFAEPSIFDNERRALEVLRGSRFVPELFAFGMADTSFSNGCSTSPFCHWICRAWVEDNRRKRLPLPEPARFASELSAFCDECTKTGLSMGDGKLENFRWCGRRLTWLDYGWFYPGTPAGVVEHNRAFCGRLLAVLGW